MWAGLMLPFDAAGRNARTMAEHSVKKAVVDLEG